MNKTAEEKITEALLEYCVDMNVRGEKKKEFLRETKKFIRQFDLGDELERDKKALREALMEAYADFGVKYPNYEFHWQIIDREP